MSNSRNIKCNFCPTWVEPGSRHKYLCERCWRIIDQAWAAARWLMELRKAIWLEAFYQKSLIETGSALAREEWFKVMKKALAIEIGRRAYH